VALVAVRVVTNHQTQEVLELLIKVLLEETAITDILVLAVVEQVH
jgi:hypothetical protein